MNGIYLYLWLREIADNIIGHCVKEVLIYQRIVQIICGQQALYISLYPELSGVFWAKRTKKGYNKLMKFKDMTSSCITSLAQSSFMPVLDITLEKKSTGQFRSAHLLVSLYHSAPNIRFIEKNCHHDLFTRYIEKKPKRPLDELKLDELQDLYRNNEENLSDMLQEFEGFDKRLARELTLDKIKDFLDIIQGSNAKPRLVSLQPFHISLFVDKCKKEYASFNSVFEDSIKQYVAGQQKKTRLQHKTNILKKLKRQLTRLQKKILSHKEIEIFRIKGELILTNLRKIKRGSSSVILIDPYKNIEFSIDLDANISPQENAQQYFSKYKKLKRGQPMIKKRIAELSKDIAEFEKAGLMIPESVSKRKEKVQTERFRKFKTASGALIYTGKDVRSNYELTFSFARPNDFFFHVRGYEGAHVILRAKIPQGQRPNKKDLLTAAGVAAFFSKAKKQKKVPVSYTQRKYLKKNKKAKAGSVILMREDVIFVDPGIPAERIE